MKLKLFKGCTIMFQGDSITDSRRIRFIKYHMGYGYCSMIKKYIEKNYKDLDMKFLNKGVYGDTTEKLKKRWENTTIKYSPNILSLLIGINDTWRRYDRNIITTQNKFYDNYAFFLESTLKAKLDTQIVIMEPFLLTVKKDQSSWFEDLNPKIQIIKKLARESNAIYIPLNEIFIEKLTTEKNAWYWTKDGVHPTKEGHELIAKQWLLYTGIIE